MMANTYDRILLVYISLILGIVRSDDQSVKEQAVDALTAAFEFLDGDDDGENTI